MISPRIELGTFCVLSRCHNQLDHETMATAAGFEPARAEPKRFLIFLLNHSDRLPDSEVLVSD